LCFANNERSRTNDAIYVGCGVEVTSRWRGTQHANVVEPVSRKCVDGTASQVILGHHRLRQGTNSASITIVAEIVARRDGALSIWANCCVGNPALAVSLSRSKTDMVFELVPRQVIQSTQT